MGYCANNCTYFSIIKFNKYKIKHYVMPRKFRLRALILLPLSLVFTIGWIMSAFGSKKSEKQFNSKKEGPANSRFKDSKAAICYLAPSFLVREISSSVIY
jgi:hypothetical protein